MFKKKYNQNVPPEYKGDEPAVFLGAWFDADDARVLLAVADDTGLDTTEVILRAVRMAGMMRALMYSHTSFKQQQSAAEDEGFVW